MKKIRIHLTGQRTMEVEAHVFGEWAAHRLTYDHKVNGKSIGTVLGTLWTVTHVPNGMRCCHGVTEGLAVSLAQSLDAAVPGGVVPGFRPGGPPGSMPRAVGREIKSVIKRVLGEVRS